MKIDLTDLKRGHWFEDLDGNKYDGLSNNLPKNKDCFIHYSIHPLVYREPISAYTYHPEHLHENNSFYQAMLCFKWFYRWMIKRMKKRGERMTFKEICAPQTTYNDQKIILAMCNSGDYTLEEAIYVYCTACERCLNALAYKYSDGEEGYPEYGADWTNCNTVCKFCESDEV